MSSYKPRHIKNQPETVIQNNPEAGKAESFVPDDEGFHKAIDSLIDELKQKQQSQTPKKVAASNTAEQQLQQPETGSEEMPKQEETPEEEPEEDDTPGKFPLIIVAAAAILILSLVIMFLVSLMQRSIIHEEPIEETIKDEITVKMPQKYRDDWLKNKVINQDYIGSIVFDSGLIDLPFVQAKSVYDRNGNPYSFYSEEGEKVEDVADYTGNDVYIWTSWKTGGYDPYGEEGSPFLDFRNSLDDQNLIIYGHHFARDFDPSGSKQFTPLDVLLEKENYEENKKLKLILDNEIREYVITNVFVIDVDDDYELNIMRRNMDEDYSGNPDPGFFKGYIDYMNSNAEYATGERLSENDRMLTLITCMQHDPEHREIVVCRETGKKEYS